MANIISNNFKDYKRTGINFDTFHNQVINMPRNSFSEISNLIKLLKSLASYILLVDKEILSKPMDCKTVYKHIFLNYKKGIVPLKNRDVNFESNFLKINDNFDRVYDQIGRNFRHYSELFSFFNIFKRVRKDGKWQRQKSIFDIESLKELELTDEEYLFDVFRNRILNVNIKDNSHIVVCKGIQLEEDADYRPARAILRYIHNINRPATDFEIAVLLGRVDEMQKENDILIRANAIGRELPDSFDRQIVLFFESMLWKSPGGVRYGYAQSQQPYFKFKTFLLMMKTFGLIIYEERSHYIQLTEYSKELVKEDIPLDVLDLHNLLIKLEKGLEDPNELTNIIINKRTDAITRAIREDGELLVKLNKRNIHNPIIIRNKRVRNKLIAEIAKIKANYLDEVTGSATFAGVNGNNYVEAHHIIEFKNENGPDITDNLICLGPESHMLIHHGAKDALDDFFEECKNKGLITFDRFAKISNVYQCLTNEHVQALSNKGIVTSEEADKLYQLITKNGIDPEFAKFLSKEALE